MDATDESLEIGQAFAVRIEDGAEFLTAHEILDGVKAIVDG